jgi:hypothetical protein
MTEPVKIIALKPLYYFIHRASLEKDLLSALSDKREYVEICKDLVDPIDQCQGFYLWGRYDKKGLWTNIYLGKAGFGKTAYLRSRIFKELTAERMSFWITRYPEKELLDAVPHLHPKMWITYSKHTRRAFLKAGTTHIAWVPTAHLSNEDVLRVEADLIEAMNPKANQVRPAPPPYLQADTRNIFEQFRTSIHEGRSERYELKPFKRKVEATVSQISSGL